MKKTYDFKTYLKNEGLWDTVKGIKNKLFDPRSPQTPSTEPEVTPDEVEQLPDNQPYKRTLGQETWARFNDYFPYQGKNKKPYSQLTPDELETLSNDVILLQNKVKKRFQNPDDDDDEGFTVAGSGKESIRLSMIQQALEQEKYNRMHRQNLAKQNLTPPVHQEPVGGTSAEFIPDPSVSPKRKAVQLKNVQAKVQEIIDSQPATMPAKDVAAMVAQETGATPRTALGWVNKLRMPPSSGWGLVSDTGERRDVNPDDYRSKGRLNQVESFIYYANKRDGLI